jgi:hypothetical protein
LVHLCANLFKIGANSLEIRDDGGYLSVVEAAYPNDRPGAARAGIFRLGSLQNQFVRPAPKSPGGLPAVQFGQRVADPAHANPGIGGTAASSAQLLEAPNAHAQTMGGAGLIDISVLFLHLFSPTLPQDAACG